LQCISFGLVFSFVFFFWLFSIVFFFLFFSLLFFSLLFSLLFFLLFLFFFFSLLFFLFLLFFPRPYFSDCFTVPTNHGDAAPPQILLVLGLGNRKRCEVVMCVCIVCRFII
jgi:hypothetical protein